MRKQEIFISKQFAVRYHTTDTQRKVRFSAHKARMMLPDDFHLASNFYEYDKQVHHCYRWFEAHLEQRQASTGFRPKYAQAYANDIDRLAEEKERKKV